MIKTVILDLDGPVLDGKLRHYSCYRKILEEKGFPYLALDQYWEMKRNRLDRHRQLAATGADIIYDDFLSAWKNSIEDLEMLEFDKVQPGAIAKLKEWRSMGLYIILATLRQHADRLHCQLRSLGLDHFLDQVIVCDYRKGGRGKAMRVKDSLPNLVSTECVWIGDTEVDVEAASFLSCPIWLIYKGIRTEAYLETLQANFLSDSISSIEISRLEPGIHTKGESLRHLNE